jgi:hypothetical protein
MSCTYTTEGSFIVLAMIRQLRSLKEEIDILELFRRVQNDVLKNYITENRQTPQVSIFPFRPTLFCARQEFFMIGVLILLLK